MERIADVSISGRIMTGMGRICIHMTEINEFRIVICFKNIYVFIEIISVCGTIENWLNLAYIVCHIPNLLTAYIFYHRG